MTTAEFMELITTLCELDHHKRNLVKAALNQQTDAIKILELIEARFELKNACPHCACVELSRYGSASGLQRYACKNCYKTFNARKR